MLHTAIDSFRVDDNRTINHHGRMRTIGDKQKNVEINNFVEDHGDEPLARDYNLVQRYEIFHSINFKENSCLDNFYRNEQKKIDAVREFYKNRTSKDEAVMNVLTYFGKYGIPVIFMIFAAIYWITGISKYFLS